MRIGMGWLGLGQDSVTVAFPEVDSGATTMTGPLPTSTELAASGVAQVGACPAGATCSIVPGIPNTNIYLAVAAIAAGFLFMGIKR